MRNLRQRTVSGLGWSGATQAVGQLLQFGISVALARLLSPGEFGLMGMVLVLSGFAANLADMGMGAAIIQMHAASTRHLDAAFWLNFVVGVVLAVGFSAAAPLIAMFYEEPQLRLLTVGVAMNFLLGSLSVVQNALLEKSLNFRTRFWIESIAISVSGIVALVMASAGAGVWSLVGQSVSLTATRSAVLWRLSPWRPRRSLDESAVKELLRFGRHLLGFNAVIYWSQNFDKLAIGRMIGNSALGIYGLADRLMRIPLANVTSITGAVMFPAFSAMQSEVESLKRVYLRSNRMIALLTFPMMMGLSVLAEPAILVIYGEKWQGAISLVQLLCFAGMAQSVYNTSTWIFLSQGRPDIMFRLAVYAAVVRVAGVMIGLQWGIVGVAWAYVLGGYVCILYPTWVAAGRLIGLRFSEILRNVEAPFYCAAGMAAVIWLSEQWILAEGARWLRLLVHVIVGVAVYALLIRTFRLRAWDDVRELILELGGRRSRLVRLLVGGSSPEGSA